MCNKLIRNPASSGRFQEKFRIHPDHHHCGIEWWGESTHPFLNFEEGMLELDSEFDEQFSELQPGLYVAVCCWDTDYESGEYGTILSSWPVASCIRTIRMKGRAWFPYWHWQIRERTKELHWQGKQLFRKVWAVSEDDGTIGHWLIQRAWLHQAFWIWFCAVLDKGPKPIIEDRWFNKGPNVHYRIERTPFL